MNNSVFIYNARLVDSETDCPGAVLVIDGKIESVLKESVSTKEAAEIRLSKLLKEDGSFFGNISVSGDGIRLYDSRGLTLMPAFIDMHVHFRYPGQSEKEDLDSGLHAAVAGGFGTLVLMANTNPVVSSLATAEEVDYEASKRGLSRVFQTVSLTDNFDGRHTEHLNNLTADVVPVISEDGRDVTEASVMFRAMTAAASRNLIVSCHCEDASLSVEAKKYRQRALEILKQCDVPIRDAAESDRISFDDRSRLKSELTEANRLLALAEDTATERNLEIARAVSCRVHIAHVSTERSMDAVRRAKEEIKSGAAPEGFAVSCEITPHHLGLCGIQEPELYELVNPPLRSETDRRALIRAACDGTADVISTDHAPHTALDKQNGAPGFSGLETAFAVCNTVLVSGGNLSLRRLSALMSGRPAELLGLEKGKLQRKKDADLVLVDPEMQWTIDSNRFFSKGKATPFDGRPVKGKVMALILGGREIRNTAILYPNCCVQCSQ